MRKKGENVYVIVYVMRKKGENVYITGERLKMFM